MSDTSNSFGPEFMGRIDQASEQLEGAVEALDEVITSIAPVDTKAKRRVVVPLERSLEMIELALDHLDVARRAAAGEAEPDEP